MAAAASGAGAGVGPHAPVPVPETLPTTAERRAALSGACRDAVELLEQDMRRVSQPDVERPFESMDDAMERLLPYHIFMAPDDTEPPGPLGAQKQKDGAAQPSTRAMLWDAHMAEKSSHFSRALQSIAARIGSVEARLAAAEHRAGSRGAAAPSAPSAPPPARAWPLPEELTLLRLAALDERGVLSRAKAAASASRSSAPG